MDTSWGLLPVPLPARTPCPGRSSRLPQLPPLPTLPVGGRSSGRGALPPRRCPGPLPASPPGNQDFKPTEERVFDEDAEGMHAAGCRAGFVSTPSTPSVVSGGTLRIILSAFLGGKKTPPKFHKYLPDRLFPHPRFTRLFSGVIVWVRTRWISLPSRFIEGARREGVWPRPGADPHCRARPLSTGPHWRLPSKAQAPRRSLGAPGRVPARWSRPRGGRRCWRPGRCPYCAPARVSASCVGINTGRGPVGHCHLKEWGGVGSVEPASTFCCPKTRPWACGGCPVGMVRAAPAVVGRCLGGGGRRVPCPPLLPSSPRPFRNGTGANGRPAAASPP